MENYSPVQISILWCPLHKSIINLYCFLSYFRREPDNIWTHFILNNISSDNGQILVKHIPYFLSLLKQTLKANIYTTLTLTNIVRYSPIDESTFESLRSCIMTSEDDVIKFNRGPALLVVIATNPRIYKKCLCMNFFQNEKKLSKKVL